MNATIGNVFCTQESGTIYETNKDKLLVRVSEDHEIIQSEVDMLRKVENSTLLPHVIFTEQ